MRLLLLTRNRFLYASRRIANAAAARGHEVVIADPLAISIGVDCVAQPPGTADQRAAQAGFPIEPHGSEIFSALSLDGKPLGHVDAVIPRIGADTRAAGYALLRNFEAAGVPCVNSETGLAVANDKFATYQALAAAGVSVPPTVLVSSPAMVESAIAAVGGAPVVLKTLDGMQGTGVMLCVSENGARSVAEAMLSTGVSLIVQRFVAEAAGKDLRVIVVDGQAIACVEREAPPGEFRANVHRGGTSRATELTLTEAEIAVAAADAVGLGVAGVDMLRVGGSSTGHRAGVRESGDAGAGSISKTPHEESGGRREESVAPQPPIRDPQPAISNPLVLEVNASPGLEGVEQASRIDVAAHIIEYAERLAGGQRRYV